MDDSEETVEDIGTKCNPRRFLTTSSRGAISDLQVRLLPFTANPPTHSRGSKPKLFLEENVWEVGWPQVQMLLHTHKVT